VSNEISNVDTDSIPSDNFYFSFIKQLNQVFFINSSLFLSKYAATQSKPANDINIANDTTNIINIGLYSLQKEK